MFCRLKFLAIGLLFTLGGCAQVASNALQDYQDARVAVRSYISEQIDYRRQIREECWRILLSEAQALQEQGLFDEARMVYSEAYPKLGLVEAIRGNGLSDALVGVNEAAPCIVDIGEPIPAPEIVPIGILPLK